MSEVYIWLAPLERILMERGLISLAKVVQERGLLIITLHFHSLMLSTLYEICIFTVEKSYNIKKEEGKSHLKHHL